MGHKFNIGDKCKIIRVERVDDVKIGDIIEIDGIDYIDSELPYRDSKYHWYCEDQLELVEEEPTVEEPKLKIEPFAEGTVSMNVPVELRKDVEEYIRVRGRSKKSELVDKLEKIVKEAVDGMDDVIQDEAERMITLYHDLLEDNGEI